jgi:hypothetical protein
MSDDLQRMTIRNMRREHGKRGRCALCQHEPRVVVACTQNQRNIISTPSQNHMCDDDKHGVSPEDKSDRDKDESMSLTFVGPCPVLAALVGVNAAGVRACIAACRRAVQQRGHVYPLR